MILIYSHTTSYRLQYICQFIFKEQLGVSYSITLNKEGFENHDGPRINYSDHNFEDWYVYNIHSQALLFEKEIRQQDVTCFETNGFKAFFRSEEASYPFDIFAASFYLLSRYEEYLPHKSDTYGRYAHEGSLAFKEGFLNQPLINIWMENFKLSLKAKFPALNFITSSFKFLPTYDIDIAWSYKSKGLLRNTGGLLRAPLKAMERIKVLLGVQKDPFDAYDFLEDLHAAHHLHPIYFFLVAARPGRYDKNIDRTSKPMIELIKRNVQRYSIGLHPSWKSFKDPGALKDEKNYLEAVGEIPINNSRQHYIKFSLPETFEQLIIAGIINDYSMGYGSINGFRASIASSFYWFDLTANRQTLLRLHPFCFMDANSFYEQKQTAAQGYEELFYYYNSCQAVNGTLITIFHNNFLGEEKKDWRQGYEAFIKRIG